MTVDRIIALDENHSSKGLGLAFFALILATINVIGGFTVTNRMLNMIAGKRREK